MHYRRVTRGTAMTARTNWRRWVLASVVVGLLAVMAPGAVTAAPVQSLSIQGGHAGGLVTAKLVVTSSSATATTVQVSARIGTRVVGGPVHVHLGAHGKATAKLLVLLPHQSGATTVRGCVGALCGAKATVKVTPQATWTAHATEGGSTATATLGPAGGTVAVVGPDGTSYSLTAAPRTLADRSVVQLHAVTTLAGSPAGAIRYGVYLNALQLPLARAPLTLTITPRHGAPPSSAVVLFEHWARDGAPIELGPSPSFTSGKLVLPVYAAGGWAVVTPNAPSLAAIVHASRLQPQASSARRATDPVEPGSSFCATPEYQEDIRTMMGILGLARQQQLVGFTGEAEVGAMDIAVRDFDRITNAGLDTAGLTFHDPDDAYERAECLLSAYRQLQLIGAEEEHSPGLVTSAGKVLAAAIVLRARSAKFEKDWLGLITDWESDLDAICATTNVPRDAIRALSAALAYERVRELLGAGDVADTHCLKIGLGLDLDATANWTGQQVLPVTAATTRVYIVRQRLATANFVESLDNENVVGFTLDTTPTYQTPSLTFYDPGCTDTWMGWATQPAIHLDLVLSAGASQLPDDEDAGSYGEPPKPREPTLQLVAIAPKSAENGNIQRNCPPSPATTDPWQIPAVSVLEDVVGMHLLDREVLVPLDGSDASYSFPNQPGIDGTESGTIRIAVDVLHS
jgi:hypothetical protein